MNFFPCCKTFAEAHRKSGSKTKIAHADKSIIKSGKEERMRNDFLKKHLFLFKKSYFCVRLSMIFL